MNFLFLRGRDSHDMGGEGGKFRLKDVISSSGDVYGILMDQITSLSATAKKYALYAPRNTPIRAGKIDVTEADIGA